MAAAPTFYVVPGSTVKSVIESHRNQIFDAVRAAYHLHASGESINPDSYFLRYPETPALALSPCRRISAARFKRAASNGSRASRITNPAIWPERRPC